MDAGVTKIVEMLLGQGPWGLLIVILLFAVYKLYTSNQELQSALNDMGRDQVKVNEATATAINRMTDTLIRGRRG